MLVSAVLFSEHKQIYEMTADQPKNNKDNLDGIAGLSNLVPVQINLRLIGEHGSRRFPLLKFHRFGAGSEKNREDVRHPKSISRVACILCVHPLSCVPSWILHMKEGLSTMLGPRCPSSWDDYNNDRLGMRIQRSNSLSWLQPESTRRSIGTCQATLKALRQKLFV